MWPLWLSLIGATCAQYTSVPSAKGPKQFAMSSDASRVIFMGAGWGDQMSIMTNHDWNNMVFVPAPFPAGRAGWMRDIATSADGSKVCMLEDEGYVQLSSDGGVTWAKVDSLGKDNWNSVTVSADGSKIFICSVGTYPNAGRVVLGTDAGSTWNDLNPGDFRYYDCSMSADGQTIVVAPHGEELMISTDGGLTFSESAGAGRSSWTKIVLSSDGSKILAGRDRHGDNNGAISSDSGATWTMPTAVSQWTHSAMSEDGTKIYVAMGDSIWSSFDGGTTWQEDFSEGGWTDLATTSDGSIVLAIKSGIPWYKNWPTTTLSTTSSAALSLW